jgi:hypothetical protein
MKKIIGSGLVLALGATLFTGCAVTPTRAIIYNNTVSPYQVTNVKASATKRGVSDKCTNILGIIATGDCSIANAKKNGHIKAVSTVDWEGFNFLGIIRSGKTIVTGE